MSKDTLTTILGAALAILHQVGLVGTIPQTKADWMNTGASALMLALGYFVNKK